MATTQHNPHQGRTPQQAAGRDTADKHMQPPMKASPDDMPRREAAKAGDRPDKRMPSGRH